MARGNSPRAMPFLAYTTGAKSTRTHAGTTRTTLSSRHARPNPNNTKSRIRMSTRLPSRMLNTQLARAAPVDLSRSGHPPTTASHQRNSLQQARTPQRLPHRPTTNQPPTLLRQSTIGKKMRKVMKSKAPLKASQAQTLIQSSMTPPRA